MSLDLKKNKAYKVGIEGSESVLASQCHLANDFFKRLQGLMFRESMEDEEAVLIVPCNSVHTFFMKFNIDLVFIDREYNAVCDIRNVEPGQVLKTVPGAWATLELKGGRLDEIGLKEPIRGSRIRFDAA